MEKIQLTGKSKHSVDDSMKGLSAVLVDGDDVFIDNGAIHAKSRIERGITFTKKLEDVQNPREVIGFWITLHRFEGQQGFYGAQPFRLYLDAEAGTGFKSLSEQVNGMDKAVKGEVNVSTIPQPIVHKVSLFLQQLRPDLWEHAGDNFRQAFSL